MRKIFQFCTSEGQVLATRPKFEAFRQLELRVGRILRVETHPDSNNLYWIDVDVGGELKIVAMGLSRVVPIQSMNGLVVLLINTKLRQFAGKSSYGLILCATNDTGAAMLRPDGWGQITYKKVEIEARKVVNDKVWQYVKKQLSTNADGYLTYQSDVIKTKGGKNVSSELSYAKIS